MHLLLCTIIYLVEFTQAAPTTNVTATSDSPEAPSFMNRTMWNIVSSCVLTLFACNYSAIHPNIPSPKDSAVRILRRRLGIMIMALIAPELIVTSWAMRQWISARYVTKQFKESGYFNVPQPQKQYENHELVEVPAEQLEDHNQLLAAPAEDKSSVSSTVHRTPVSTSRYRKTHALAKPFKILFKAYVSEQSENYAWTQGHSFFVLMGGLMLYVDGEPYHTLQPDQVLTLIREECIDAPSITAKQISDRSKGNIISKGLIMLQVAWFVLQLISRAIYHLETTMLEAGTLAFAVLNFLTYALWWNKPLDVQCPHPVYWKSTKSKPEDYIDDVPIPEDDDSTDATTKSGIVIFDAPLELMGSFDILTSRQLRVPTFNGCLKLRDSDPVVLLIAGLLMATIFGGIHCMAWFFAFPTYHEQVLWRVSAIIITCTPWLGCFLMVMMAIFPNKTLQGFVGFIGFFVIFLLYIPARAVLLVLMFTTLRNLPPGTYEAVSWTSFIPHL